MGSSLSSVIAALLLNNSTKLIANGLPKDTVILIYADDILIVGNLMQIGRVVQNYERLLNEMPLTIEFETLTNRNTYFLQYLELGLERAPTNPLASNSGSLISTVWKHKPYHSKATLHYLSYHVWETKQGLLYNMLNKAITLSSTNMIKIALEEWFNILSINEYPKWLQANLAYSYISDHIQNDATAQRIKTHISNFCQVNNISKTDPSSPFKRKLNREISNIAQHPGPSMAKKKKIMTLKKAYISFPMAEGLKCTQKLIRNLIPSAVIAPNTKYKHSDTLYTKIKDPLDHSNEFEKVITFCCQIDGCKTKFIALIKDNSLFDTLTNIISYQQSAYHKHYIDSHQLSPRYPQNIRTVSKKDETGNARLNNRLIVEMTNNQNLILITSKPPPNIQATVLEAIAKLPKTI